MYVDILILANLVTQPKHGYDIKKQVERELGPTFALNNGLLYPALRRLVQIGAIERQVEHHLGKPDRHMYQLTDQGQAFLHTFLCDFSAEIALSDAEFLVRVAFFDLLTTDERLTILHTRRNVLNERMALLTQFHPVLPMVPQHQYGNLVQEFCEQLAEHELAWIEKLAHESSDSSRERRVHQ